MMLLKMLPSETVSGCVRSVVRSFVFVIDFVVPSVILFP